MSTYRCQLDYAKQRHHHHGHVPRSIRKRKLGKIGKLTAYIVNGERVRNEIDIDFTMGGSSARYLYVPLNEIWLDGNMNALDATATLLHEYSEYLSMMDGKSYEAAHDLASADEQFLRDKLAGKKLRKIDLNAVKECLR